MNSNPVIQSLSEFASLAGVQMKVIDSTVTLSPVKISHFSKVRIIVGDSASGNMSFCYFVGKTQLTPETTLTCLSVGVDSEFDYSQTYDKIYEGVSQGWVTLVDALSALEELSTIDWGKETLVLQITLVNAFEDESISSDPAFASIATAVKGGTTISLQADKDGLRLYTIRPEDIGSVYDLCVQGDLQINFLGISVNNELQSEEMNVACTQAGWGNLSAMFNSIALRVKSTKTLMRTLETQAIGMNLLKHYRVQKPVYRYVFSVRHAPVVATSESDETYEQACSKYGAANVAVIAKIPTLCVSTNPYIVELSAKVRDTRSMLLHHYTMSHSWTGTDAQDLWNFWSALAPAYYAGKQIGFSFGRLPADSAQLLNLI